MKKIFLFIFLITLNAFGQSFDFNKNGNIKANNILKEYVFDKLPGVNGEVVSYFADIDEDGESEIIGIMKTQYFYSLSGYKLLVLRKENNSWESVKSDVYFDIANNFEIENKKITYYKTIFYKNKKCLAYIKKDKIKTIKSIFDTLSEKKAHDIEEITKFNVNNQHNDFELENFNATEQQNVKIKYENLDEKTKHYLELK